ncbi:MAG: hypothetical protein CMP11_09400 [Zetaproteobacteria bacterium]|nr:hypothetical protein [Pseudobdellovibrionaceae bacterium]
MAHPHIKTLLPCQEQETEKADYLILKIQEDDFLTLGTWSKTQKDSFLHKIFSYAEKNIFPIIYSPVMPISLEILYLLSKFNLHVAIHDKIYQKAKVVEKKSLNFGSYKKLKIEDIGQKICLMPINFLHKHKFNNICSSKQVLVGKSSHFKDETVDFFPLNNENRFKKINQIIKQTSPKKIFVTGSYNKKNLSKSNTLTHIQYLNPNNQPSLF